MPRRSSASSVVIPPPVNGWNTKDAISNMDPTYATDLVNYFPNNGTVDLRNGYRYHSKTIGSGAVKTIGTLEYGSVSKLVAIGADSKIYDASTASAAATDISGIETVGPYSQIIQFRDRIFIKSTNSAEDVFHWTGTGNIAKSNFVGPSSEDRDLFAMGVYKSRLYFAQQTVPSIWYGGVDAVTGTLTEFPLASVLQKGFSYIAFVGSVSRNKQYAEEELFCVVTDTGEVLIFQGDYPGSTTWALIGRYAIPRPASNRAFFYYGSSLYILTATGTISVKDLLSGNTENGIYPSISSNIDSALTETLQLFPLNIGAFGQGIGYPRGTYLMLNLQLTSSSDTFMQAVMNTKTNAWAKFTGQNGYHWVVWGQSLYFGGGSGRVFKADNGYFDEDPTSEGSVLTRSTKLKTAFNYFGDPSGVKQFTECRPILQESEGINITLDVDVDYGDTTPTSNFQDLTDTSYKLYRPRLGLQGIGKAASIRIEQSVTTKRRSIQAFEVLYNEGDIT